MGMPTALNHSRIGRGIGAAPVMATISASNPSSARTWLKATASRKAHVSFCSCVAVPARSAALISRAAASPSSNFCCFSGSAASAALTPRYTFSHTRGTPNMISGCTSRAYAAIWVGSGHDVTDRPDTMPW